MRKIVATMFLLILCTMFFDEAHAEKRRDFKELMVLRQILEQKERQLDLAKIKLTIDKLIEPSINVEQELNKINQIVSDIQFMIPPDASQMDKMLAIKKYIYTSGTWNNYKAYHYDFDDPLGTKISNKLLSNYIRSRKGNCITMPFLFIILGNKLGVDVAASVAPLHVFVKFTDSDGQTYNIETTSGANFSRDTWYRKQMPMTDRAIKNGIYLQALSKRETVSIMMTVLAEYYMNEKEYKKVVSISELSLRYYPKYVNAMLRIGSAFYLMLQESFVKKYPHPNDIPQNKKELFRFLSNGNRYWFAKAETLGWQEPGRDNEEKYLESVKRDSMKGGM
ncbi:MAG: hypothetical protein GY699_07000 [Desulfobacteraceae bacterium]|nr:hypothetical protein [Desulfobacteraceae bacterium]